MGMKTKGRGEEVVVFTMWTAGRRAGYSRRFCFSSSPQQQQQQQYITTRSAWLGFKTCLLNGRAVRSRCRWSTESIGDRTEMMGWYCPLRCSRR